AFDFLMLNGGRIIARIDPDDLAHHRVLFDRACRFRRLRIACSEHQRENDSSPRSFHYASPSPIYPQPKLHLAEGPSEVGWHLSGNERILRISRRQPVDFHHLDVWVDCRGVYEADCSRNQSNESEYGLRFSVVAWDRLRIADERCVH